MNSLFELLDVEYRYGQVPALNQVSLNIQPGERIALLGANGSGKSTLLRLLAALLFPGSGECRFQGQPLTAHTIEDERFALAFRRQVQLVFQNADAQLFCGTVEEEVAFGPLQLGLSVEEVQRRIETALGTLDIDRLKNRPPHRLSGGEKKRVALAAITAVAPEVLLLDEPTAALDPHTQGQIVDFLQDLDAGKTVITATHDLELVPEIATRCLVFQAGELVADGTPGDILGDIPLLEHTNLLRKRRPLRP